MQCKKCEFYINYMDSLEACIHKSNVNGVEGNTLYIDKDCNEINPNGDCKYFEEYVDDKNTKDKVLGS